MKTIDAIFMSVMISSVLTFGSCSVSMAIERAASRCTP